jgi:hypothetical protein
MIIKTARILLIILFLILGIVLLKPRQASASEGLFELSSTTNQDYRCFAPSIQLLDSSYRVVITCRDLVYPAGDDIFSYMLWANPVDGGKAIKLGVLGFGRDEFKTKAAFSTLFVTTEKNKKTKTPEGPVVMRGNIKRISFLDKKEREAGEEEIAPTDEQEATPSPTPSTRDRLIAGIKRAGLVALLAFAAIIGLVFVITRSK